MVVSSPNSASQINRGVGSGVKSLSFTPSLSAITKGSVVCLWPMLSPHNSSGIVWLKLLLKAFQVDSSVLIGSRFMYPSQIVSFSRTPKNLRTIGISAAVFGSYLLVSGALELKYQTFKETKNK